MTPYNKALAAGMSTGTLEVLNIPQGFAMVMNYYTGMPLEIGVWFGTLISGLASFFLVYYIPNKVGQNEQNPAPQAGKEEPSKG